MFARKLFYQNHLLLPFVFLVVLISHFTIRAHEPLPVQIEEVTKQIKEAPKNPELYLRRGELHRQDRNWRAAQADYDKAQKLNPGLIEIEYVRGATWLEAGQPKLARGPLDRFLKLKTDRAEAWVTRARVLAKLKEYRASAADYSQAIRLYPNPKPDHYVERANVLVAAGVFNEALQGIDEGMAKLGEIVTLQLEAIEIELKRKNCNGALTRLDKIIARSVRKETFLARRGEILKEAGRMREARQTFTNTLEAIETLPPRLRQTKATAELERKVRAELL